MTAVLSNRGHDAPDQHHFIDSESVAAHDVAISARGLHVAANVGKVIINPIKTAILRHGATVNAGFVNYLSDFTSRKIAFVNPLVCFSQKASPTLARCIIPALPRLNLFSLFRGVFVPPIWPVIPPLLPLAMARPAFVGDAEMAGLVPQEKFRRCWKKVFTPIAKPLPSVGRNTSLSHNGDNSMTPTTVKDGPHWQLSWVEYP